MENGVKIILYQQTLKIEWAVDLFKSISHRVSTRRFINVPREETNDLESR